MANRQALQVACAEDISLLSLLHSVPTKPKSNPLNFLSGSHKYTYSLPFDKERQLASILAFISSIKDDHNHIPAVCVGEECDSSYLRIILAVNKTNSSDGNNILDSLTKAFREIFCILARGFEDEHGSFNTEGEVFTVIVKMCSSRILNRLGLVRGRRGQKKPIQDILAQAIECINHNNNNTQDPGMIPIIASFITSAREIIKLVNSWNNFQTPARLESLVEGIYQLHQQQITLEILSPMPHRKMDPSLTESLLNMTGKISRYRQAARFLCRTAKNFPITRRARIESVNLPQEAFCVFDVSQYKPRLLATISRSAPNFMDANKLSQIWGLLKTTESNAQNCFSQQTRDTLQQAKIHAEVQLIYHCELQSTLKFPRVVCSSKDACFLCNAFISMHGKTHTPRCHGRLYPGWKLPVIPQANDLQQRLNIQLEKQINDSLRTIVSSKKRTVHPCPPYESTLLTIPTSISTQISSQSHQSALEVMQSEVRPSESRNSLPVISSVDEDEVDAIEVDQLTLEESPSEPNDFPAFQALHPGITLREQIKSISPLYAAGLLEVQIEYENQSASAVAPNNLLYSVEWLSAVDAEKIEDICHSNCVIEVESLTEETCHVTCSQNTLYLAACGSVLRLRFHANALDQFD